MRILKDESRLIGVLIALSFIVHIINLFIDLMDVDTAQYGSISMEMWQNGGFLEVKHRLKDYLDKPPLLFWLSAISYKTFGLGNFAYKLPTFLFVVLGCYATYRLARYYYKEEIARLSALIFISIQALFLITNDVRTDTILMCSIIFSIWQLMAFVREGHWKYLLGGFTGIALAMLTKGPIGVVTPAFALTVDFVSRRQWKNFIRWEWLVGLVVVAILLSPMVYGLYVQYDLHPEVVTTYGETGVSGVKFYFWTQSFGRITGESVWKDDKSDPFFFVHTFAWSFLPWTLLAFGGVFRKIFQFFKQKLKAEEGQEFFSACTTVAIIMAMSKSHYKLPHYIYPILPLASIVSAEFLYSLKGRGFAIGQFVVVHILLLVPVLLVTYTFPEASGAWYLLPVVILGISWYVFLQPVSHAVRVILPSAVAIIGINFFLSSYFYPHLIDNYQAASVIGKMVRDGEIPQDKMYYYRYCEHSLEFYSGRILPECNSLEQLRGLPEGTYLYIEDMAWEDFIAAGRAYEEIGHYDDYAVTELSIEFLNKARRQEVLQFVKLVKLK